MSKASVKYLVTIGMVLVLGLAVLAPIAAAAEQITVAAFSGPELDAHKRLAPQFEKLTNGKIKVRVEEIARSLYDTKMLGVLSGRTGTYDVFLANVPRFNLWQQAGYLQPLDTYLNDPQLTDAAAYNVEDYPKAILALTNVDGHQYGIPQEASAILMFYRKDLLKNAGIAEPPAIGYDWDTYLNVAQKLTVDTNGDGQIDQYGSVHSGKRSQHVGIETTQAIWSFGGDLYNDKNYPTMTEPVAVKAAKLYTSQYEKGIVLPGVIGYEYPEILTAFQQGKAAMAIEWNAASATILNSDKSPITAGNTGFTVFPYSKELGPDTTRIWPSVHNLVMSADSRHKEAAWEYIKWFTSKETARNTVMYGGGSSGRQSLLGDPKVAEANSAYPTLGRSFGLYHSLPRFPEFQYTLQNIFAPHMNEVLASDTPVEGALEATKNEIINYLKRAGYKF